MSFEFSPFSLIDAPGSCAIIFCRGCNLRCKYCYNTELFDTTKGLSLQEVIEALKNTQQESVRGKFNTIEWLIISGGEPLCGQLSEISTLIDVARDMGLKIGMYTNGISPHFMNVVSKLDFLNLDFKHWNSSFNKGDVKYSILDPIKLAYKSYMLGDLKYCYFNTVVCNSLHSIKDLKQMKFLLETTIERRIPILEKRSEGNFGWLLTPFFNDFDKAKTLGDLSYMDNKVDIKSIKEKL